MLVPAGRGVIDQHVEGVVVLAGAGTPVAGSLVTLIGSGGEAIGFTVTDDSGHFRLKDGEGRSIRIESIGRPVVEAAIPAAGNLRIEIPAARLKLPAASTSECRALPESGEAVQMAWTEARKALRIESWARSQHVYSYDVFQYERRLSDKERIESERGRRLDNLPEGPARTRPPAELMSDGYARSTPRGDVLYAPDADALLSEGFADTHCFRLESSRGARVGLGFEPKVDRGRVDIRGVIWLDATTSELKSIEFRYTGLAGAAPVGPGGVVEFARLKDGLWALSHWAVRTPAPRTAPERFREDGVDVLRVVRLDGTAIPVRSRAQLLGTVRDGKGAIIAGANVQLQGTDYLATTNADGRFYIPDVPPGRFHLSVRQLDSPAGSPVLGQDVVLTANQNTQVDVNLASARSADIVQKNVELSSADSIRLFLQSAGLAQSQRVDSLISDALYDKESGRLVGRVFDRSTGRGISGVDVRLAGTSHVAVTGNDGRFFIGDVKAGDYVMQTNMIGYAARADTIDVPPGLVIEALVAMNTKPIELDPISVNVLSRWLDANGFFERRRAGLDGHFFTRAEIEKKNPAQFTDLLRDLPGVLILTEEIGKTSVHFRRTTTIARAATEARGCEPGVYYDGIPLNAGWDQLHNIPIPFIDGIEVYVGAATPIDYKNSCGVILIWTRRPR
jgi:Carboxypeptidase regulatory-like domain/TonB-dependent Receptor Plug Domain